MNDDNDDGLFQYPDDIDQQTDDDDDDAELQAYLEAERQAYLGSAERQVYFDEQAKAVEQYARERAQQILYEDPPF